MNIAQTTKAALALLTKRDRIMLGLVVAIQFFIALLDLAGILLLGVVATLAASSFSGSSVSDEATVPFIGSLPTSIGFVVGLSVAAGVLLISKWGKQVGKRFNTEYNRRPSYFTHPNPHF